MNVYPTEMRCNPNDPSTVSRPRARIHRDRVDLGPLSESSESTAPPFAALDDPTESRALTNRSVGRRARVASGAAGARRFSVYE